MAMLLFVASLLWSIIGDSGFVISSVVPSAQTLLSFHLSTGKMGTRPVEAEKSAIPKAWPISTAVSRKKRWTVMKW
jgi:hypothetical protein